MLLPVAVPLARAVERVVETIQPQIIELTDGAKTTLPANAIAGSGSASISMKPAVEAPSFGASTVVGTGYQVSASTSAGVPITVLNAEITIAIPYSEDELAGRGLRAEDLVLSFFDETANAWKPLEKQVIDKASKTVSGTVSHLTLFALVAPADTTPPLAPARVSVAVSGSIAMVAWANPTTDFHHVKIYRSEKEGDLGAVAFNYLTGVSQSDAWKGAVYYVVRAVDLAGNESTNIKQYKAEAGAASGAMQQPAVSSGVSLVRAEGDSRVYAVVKNIKRHIPNAAIFAASGFRWADIQTVSAEILNAYSTSNLVKIEGSPKVYFIADDGIKVWIQSAETFIAIGYRWDLIVTISARELSAYADPSKALLLSAERDLKLGARGSEVRALQEFLARSKKIYPEGRVTGYYGKLTQAAVRNFQEQYGIVEVFGTVGPKTRERMNQLWAH